MAEPRQAGRIPSSSTPQRKTKRRSEQRLVPEPSTPPGSKSWPQLFDAQGSPLPMPATSSAYHAASLGLREPTPTRPPATVPRRITEQTPLRERQALLKLKKKMDFSDVTEPRAADEATDQAALPPQPASKGSPLSRHAEPAGSSSDESAALKQYQELVTRERVLEGIMTKHREIDALQQRLEHIQLLRTNMEAKLVAGAGSSPGRPSEVHAVALLDANGDSRQQRSSHHAQDAGHLPADEETESTEGQSEGDEASLRDYYHQLLRRLEELQVANGELQQEKDLLDQLQRSQSAEMARSQRLLQRMPPAASAAAPAKPLPKESKRSPAHPSAYGYGLHGDAGSSPRTLASAEAFASAQYRQYVATAAGGGARGTFDPVLAQHQREMERRRARIQAYRTDLHQLVQVKRDADAKLQSFETGQHSQATAADDGTASDSSFMRKVHGCEAELKELEEDLNQQEVHFKTAGGAGTGISLVQTQYASSDEASSGGEEDGDDDDGEELEEGEEDEDAASQEEQASSVAGSEAGGPAAYKITDADVAQYSQLMAQRDRLDALKSDLEEFERAQAQYGDALLPDSLTVRAASNGTLGRLREDMREQLEMQKTLEEEYAEVIRLKARMSAAAESGMPTSLALQEAGDAGELSDTGTYTVEVSACRPRRPANYGDGGDEGLLWDGGFGRRSQRRGFVSDSEDEEQGKVVVGKKRRLAPERPADSRRDQGASVAPYALKADRTFTSSAPGCSGVWPSVIFSRGDQPQSNGATRPSLTGQAPALTGSRTGKQSLPPFVGGVGQADTPQVQTLQQQLLSCTQLCNQLLQDQLEMERQRRHFPLAEAPSTSQLHQQQQQNYWSSYQQWMQQMMAAGSIGRESTASASANSPAPWMCPPPWVASPFPVPASPTTTAAVAAAAASTKSEEPASKPAVTSSSYFPVSEPGRVSSTPASPAKASPYVFSSAGTKRSAASVAPLSGSGATATSPSKPSFGLSGRPTMTFSAAQSSSADDMPSGRQKSSRSAAPANGARGGASARSNTAAAQAGASSNGRGRFDSLDMSALRQELGSLSGAPGGNGGVGRERVDSLASAAAAAATSQQSDGYSLFETLRDSVYSEVATVISLHEARPHFLLEVFRSLQLLTSDYLRQQSLDAMSAIVSDYITNADFGEGDVMSSVDQASRKPRTAVEYGNGFPERTLKSVPARNAGLYDYSESLESASSLDTLADEDLPFASESLGSTAVQLGEELRRLAEAELSADVQLAGANRTGMYRVVSYSSDSDAVGDVDADTWSVGMQQIDNHVEAVVEAGMQRLRDLDSKILDADCLQGLEDTLLKALESKLSFQIIPVDVFRKTRTELSSLLMTFLGKRMEDSGSELMSSLTTIVYDAMKVCLLRLVDGVSVEQDSLVKDSDGMHEDSDGDTRSSMTTPHQQQEAASDAPEPKPDNGPGTAVPTPAPSDASPSAEAGQDQSTGTASPVSEDHSNSAVGAAAETEPDAGSSAHTSEESSGWDTLTEAATDSSSTGQQQAVERTSADASSRSSDVPDEDVDGDSGEAAAAAAAAAGSGNGHVESQTVESPDASTVRQGTLSDLAGNGLELKMPPGPPVDGADLDDDTS